MKIFTITFVLLLSAKTCWAKTVPIALVYNGPGACRVCPQSVGRVLTQMGFAIDYVKPGQLTKIKFQQAQIYVQPGGTDRPNDILEALSKTEILNLRNFVKSGGKYLGLCSGGYLAGTFVTDDKKTKAFGLLPIVVDEEDEDSASKVISIDWKKKHYNVYFQNGPSFDLSSLPKADVWATYQESGHAAAVISEFGKGRVGVIGPHLEADLLWFLDDNLPFPGLRFNLLSEFIKALIK